MQPLADFSLRPTLGVLTHIPSGRKTPSLVKKLLADVPFGRFFASSHFGCPYSYTLWPKNSFWWKNSLLMYPLADYSLRPTALIDIPSGRITFLRLLFTGFSWILSANMGACWHPRRSMLAPKREKTAWLTEKSRYAFDSRIPRLKYKFCNVQSLKFHSKSDFFPKSAEPKQKLK